VAVLLALVAKCGVVAVFVGGCPLGGLAALVAVCARLGVLALLHLILHNGDINPVWAVAFDHHFNAIFGVFFGCAVTPYHAVAVA
jgi:hypothetical protein